MSVQGSDASSLTYDDIVDIIDSSYDGTTKFLILTKLGLVYDAYSDVREHLNASMGRKPRLTWDRQINRYY
jgi:hypothetical protein